MSVFGLAVRSAVAIVYRRMGCRSAPVEFIDEFDRVSRQDLGCFAEMLKEKHQARIAARVLIADEIDRARHGKTFALRAIASSNRLNY